MIKRIIFLVFLLSSFGTAISQQLRYNSNWDSDTRIWMNNFPYIPNADFNFQYSNSNGSQVFAVYSVPERQGLLSVVNDGRVGIRIYHPNEKFHVNCESLFSKDVFFTPNKTIILKHGNSMNEFNIRINSNEVNDKFIIKAPDNNSILRVNGSYGVSIGDFTTTVYNFGVKGSVILDGDVTVDRGFYPAIAKINDKSIFKNGLVGINTIDPTENLDVNGNALIEGTLYADKAVLSTGTFPDYVFEEDYKLLSLLEIEKFIDTHKHLPNVPSASEIESKGMNAVKMNIIMMEKVEELMLHTINQNKKLEKLEEEFENMISEIEAN
ncbi:MAG: hypothetical protein ACEPOV_10260 [Hyphomicrobiales bacterium]